MAKENATLAEAFADRKKKIFMTTPKGPAVYPHLIVHDKWQFDENGVYQCNTGLRVSEDDPYVVALTAMADEALELGKADLEARIAKGDLKGKELKKAKDVLAALVVNYPWDEDADEEGEPNGMVVLKTKTTVQGVTKETKEVWKKEVPIFDSKGQPIKGEARSSLKLWAGSTIRVSTQVVPYSAEGLKLAGVSLRITGVQVIQLAGGGATAETMGFGVEEDGYEAEAFDDSAVPESAAAAERTEAEPEDDDDF